MMVGQHLRRIPRCWDVFTIFSLRAIWFILLSKSRTNSFLWREYNCFTNAKNHSCTLITWSQIRIILFQQWRSGASCEETFPCFPLLCSWRAITDDIDIYMFEIINKIYGANCVWTTNTLIIAQLRWMSPFWVDFGVSGWHSFGKSIQHQIIKSPARASSPSMGFI